VVAVVLLGAGASFGSGVANADSPPLGTQLFDRLVNRGGLAAALPADLQAVFRKDFEEGMAAFYEWHGGNIAQFQRELAGYLAEFSPAPDSVYLKMLSSLGSRRFVYCTLNYDLLFELAAGMIGANVYYGTVNAPPACFQLLKLHGSCNFWPNVGTNQFIGGMLAGNQVDIEAPVRCHTQDGTLERCRSEDTLYPSIAMFARGKQIKSCPKFVERQQAEWRNLIPRASRIFVSGVRVHIVDEHIWTVLGKARAPVVVYGLGSPTRMRSNSGSRFMRSGTPSFEKVTLHMPRERLGGDDVRWVKCCATVAFRDSPWMHEHI
jgi:hypothetical protein